jgi:hypothetical protein
MKGVAGVAQMYKLQNLTLFGLKQVACTVGNLIFLSAKAVTTLVI